MYTPLHIVKRITTNIVDDSPNGGLTHSTKTGIIVGLVLFCILVTAFYFVAMHHKKRRPPTPAEVANARTFERWSENLAGKGKSARICHSQQDRDRPPEYSFPPYRPNAGSTGVKADEHMPAPPPIAYILLAEGVQSVGDTKRS